MRAEVRRLMEARIDLLPDAFRTVFMLRAVEELSVQRRACPEKRRYRRRHGNRYGGCEGRRDDGTA